MGIKELFNKIFKKEKQKMFPVYSDFITTYDINLEQIQEFLKSEKYKKIWEAGQIGHMTIIH